MQDRWVWPFELEEKIGDGGMGVVYRGRYVKDDRRFAVKLLPLDLADQTILARFEREMDVMKTLRHPNIVRCFGGVCGDKKRFYAMELVEGGTLAEILHERTRLPWEEAVEHALQMCKALAYAHSKGVVHRDVKPSNFLVTNTGKLKLSDFGLISVAADSRLTAAGKTMGTIPYMAPEQIRGTPPPSPQTDLYALGCVLFEMISGQPPFRGNAPAETMHLHLNETPPRLTRFVRDCPRALEGLVGQLMEKDPADRPSDALAVARKLEDIWQAAALGNETIDAHVIEEVPEAPRRPTVRRPGPERSGVPVWLLGASLAFAATLLAWNLLLVSQSRGSSRAEVQWFEAMKSDKSEVRIAAAESLGEVATDFDRAATELIRALDDPIADVRLASAASLSKLGAHARPAVAVLLKLQNTDTSAPVREQAAKTIEIIGQAKPRSRWALFLAFTVVLLGLCAVGILAAVRSYRSAEIKPP